MKEVLSRACDPLPPDFDQRELVLTGIGFPLSMDTTVAEVWEFYKVSEVDFLPKVNVFIPQGVATILKIDVEGSPLLLSFRSSKRDKLESVLIKFCKENKIIFDNYDISLKEGTELQAEDLNLTTEEFISKYGAKDLKFNKKAAVKYAEQLKEEEIRQKKLKKLKLHTVQIEPKMETSEIKSVKEIDMKQVQKTLDALKLLSEVIGKDERWDHNQFWGNLLN
eukprot:TRINITY_DN13798_c1_g1_i2.p1 TRINITY_DN13798_c1_g1~~TRINITY_DN13798_c1_g1_i2.p1  ORF type:complete len:222 (-),score=68.20 TRINITY_DN13798_c1_g1_i2:166-831(-)